MIDVIIIIFILMEAVNNKDLEELEIPSFNLLISDIGIKNIS
jgi:hypothetical protein